MLNETLKAKMQQALKIENVMSVYSGKAGRCCCGCCGKHTYASAHREAASKDRGYAIEDNEINDRTVKLIVGKIAARLDNADEDNDADVVSVEEGGRMWVAYLKPAAGVPDNTDLVSIGHFEI